MSESDDMTELTEALERLGREHVAVDDERIDAVHARMTAAVTDEESQRGAAVSPDDRRSVRALLLGAVAASLIALAVLAGVFATDSDGVVIAAAEGVEVTLPGGDVVNGRAGLELPDGTEVDVTGFVEIDGVRYGPGSYVIVDDSIRPTTPEDGSGDIGEPGDGELDAPGRDPDTPLPTASSTTTTTLVDAPDAPADPVERDGADDDGANDRATSTTSAPRRDGDGPGRDRPTTTTDPASVDTRPATVSTVLPPPPTTAAPTRTTTTQAPRPRPTPPPASTTAPRDRPTTTAATTTTTTTTVSPTTTIRDRPPTRP